LIETELESQFDRGYVSPYLSSTLTGCGYETKLSGLQELPPPLEAVVQASKLLIIAREAMREDIAILTGGTIVSADLGIKLEKLTVKKAISTGASPRSRRRSRNGRRAAEEAEPGHARQAEGSMDFGRFE
jgi:chaperonin GroEL (HSP60 family)